MPQLQREQGTVLSYLDDDCTDPWKPSEAILLLHGFMESNRVWNRWMPQLARRFRVVRPDLRGFGESTPMHVDYEWTAEALIDDFIALMDRLDIKRFHLVGAKVAGIVAIRFATLYPKRVQTLTVAGSTWIGGGLGPRNNVTQLRERFLRDGVENFARETMGGRLGSDCAPDMAEGFVKLMGRTASSTAAGFSGKIPATDVSQDLKKLPCPMLAIVIEDGGPGILEATKERIAEVPQGELVVLPGDSYHVAATHAEQCARATIDFIDRHAVVAGS